MNMDEVRLIDANALKEYKCSACGDREWCEDRETVCSDIAEIDEQPTVESEPVKANWVQRGGEYFCSRCGGNAPMNINRKHTVTTKFCPHCGYKMGG